MALNLTETHNSHGGKQGVYTHDSVVLDGQMEFSVFVPPQAENAGSKLPVLYYLSGLTCSQDNVTTKGGFQRYASEHGMIVVCPDTSPRGKAYAGEDDDYDFGSGAGFYVNATQMPWSQSYQMYDYIVDELPALIAANFPVDQNRCGIFGHSMGGHGALTIALKNPEKFKSVSAFSPIVAPSQVPWGQKAFLGYLGDDPQAWQQYDATALVKAGYSIKSKILIDQGLADNFLEEQLKPALFEQACSDAKQALEVRRQAGYDHSYYFIATFMQDHITHHANILG